MTATADTPPQKPWAKFVLPSALGAMLFLLPVPGPDTTIHFGILIDWVNTNFGTLVSYTLLVVTVISAAASLWFSYGPATGPDTLRRHLGAPCLDRPAGPRRALHRALHHRSRPRFRHFRRHGGHGHRHADDEPAGALRLRRLRPAAPVRLRLHGIRGGAVVPRVPGPVPPAGAVGDRRAGLLARGRRRSA